MRPRRVLGCSTLHLLPPSLLLLLLPLLLLLGRCCSAAAAAGAGAATAAVACLLLAPPLLLVYPRTSLSALLGCDIRHLIHHFWVSSRPQKLGDEGVVIAQFDATANDAPANPKLSVRGFPTLYFVTAKGDGER